MLRGLNFLRSDLLFFDLDLKWPCLPSYMADSIQPKAISMRAIIKNVSIIKILNIFFSMIFTHYLYFISTKIQVLSTSFPSEANVL